MMTPRDINPFQLYGRDRIRRIMSRQSVRPVSWLAQGYRRTWGRHTRVVAITGSFGKTSTTLAMLTAFGLKKSERQNRSYNAFTSLYLQLIRQVGRAPWAVLEVGIGKPGQMHRYGEIVQPNIVVVTGIGTAHLENFPDGIEQLRREKYELVRALSADGTAILNHDDPNTLWMASQTKTRTLTYGFDPNADVVATDVESIWPNGTTFNVQIEDKSYPVRTHLIGRAGVYTMLAAIAVAHVSGQALSKVITSLESFLPVSSRLEIVQLPNGATLLIDDMKGTPSTVRHAIEVLKNAPAGRRVAVLGHLPRDAPEPKESEYQSMGQYAGQVLDRAYLTHRIDSQYEAYRDGLIAGGMEASQIVRVRSVHDAAEQLRSDLQPSDVLLIKAHIHDRLVRIALLLQEVPVRCRAQICPRLGMVPCRMCSLLERDLDPPLPKEEAERLLENHLS